MWEKQFDAANSLYRVDEADVLVACIPTPIIDVRDHYLTHVVNSAISIATRLRPCQLIVVESRT